MTATWTEEIGALQTKLVRHVRTPAGVEKYDLPEGAPIVAHPDLPHPSAPHVDARHTQGQTPGNFVHPVTGHAMGKTEIGDTYEQLFKAKMAKELNSRYGCCLRLITGAGSGTNRTTPLDFNVGDQGGEVKTLSSLSKNQKTAIKSAEVARKLAAVAEHGWSPLLIVQVVDQKTGNVSVYLYPGFESKAVKKMTLIGTYHYAPADFQKAQKNSGHWDKAAGRAAEQAAKQGAQKALGTPTQLGKLGMRYDPPDEEGGVIEPGDTVIELHQVGAKLVPFIFTHPDDSGPGPAGQEVKLFGRGKKPNVGVAGVDEVATHAGEKRYNAPIGTPIIAHPHAPRIWKSTGGGYEHVSGSKKRLSFTESSLIHDHGKITVRGGREQGFRFEGSVGPSKRHVNGDGFKTIAEAKAAAEKELDKEPVVAKPSRPTSPNEPHPHTPDIVTGSPAAPSAPRFRTPSAPAAPSAAGHSASPPPSSEYSTGPDISPDLWGGPGAQAGMSATGADGKAIPPRKPPGRWAKLVEERGNGRGFFGKVTPDEYVQGLKEGAFDSYTPTYKASWLDPDGVVNPVSSHDMIPGGENAMATAGGIRTIITTMAPGKTALTPPIKLVLQFQQKPTARQVSGIRSLMEQLGIQHATVSFNVGMVHWEQMMADRRSEGTTLKRGEYQIEGADLILKFLTDPTKTPEEHQKATGRTVDRRFLSGGEGVFDPGAAPGSRAFSGAKDDELDDLDGRLADMELMLSMVDGLDAKAVRHVRTPEGVRLYDEPVGSVIAPHPSRIRPSLRDDSQLHPTPYPPRPLSQHRTRPASIDPREFDDFLDMVDPRLGEKWRADSGPGGYDDLWAWVATLPPEDQWPITQATARMLETMRQQGKGWLVDLEGKDAVRHLHTPVPVGGVLDRLAEAMEKKEVAMATDSNGFDHSP